MKALTKLGKFSLTGALLLLISGCASLPSMPKVADLLPTQDIHVEVPDRPATMALQRTGKDIVLLVPDYIDTRANKKSRRVGGISTTVVNMYGDEFFLDQEITTLLSAAVRKQLTNSGFKVVTQATSAYDFELIGAIGNFSLNIADRDKLNIAVETTVMDGKTGKVLWSGIISEISDRFAGVSGNTRSSIEEYLGNGVAEFSVKTSASIKENLAGSYPLTMKVGQSKTVSSVPGVTTLQAVVDLESKPELAVADSPIASTQVGVGHFSVTTFPARAKVYVNDVYYGMSPLKLAFDPSIYALRFELEGYKAVTEKVSVRRGETTELEIKFAK
ncbi:MAG: PEGA domain-containing protein [Methylotenera sp.]|nr:PEGA domain-containing protein [Methylotenera sp.]